MDMEYERTVRGIKGTNCKDLAFQIKCLFTLRICSYKKEFCKDNFSSEEDKVFAAEMIDHYETELSDRLIKLFDNYPSLNELKKILPESEYKQLSDAATRTLPEQIQKVVDEMARPSF